MFRSIEWIALHAVCRCDEDHMSGEELAVVETRRLEWFDCLEAVDGLHRRRCCMARVDGPGGLAAARGLSPGEAAPRGRAGRRIADQHATPAGRSACWNADQVGVLGTWLARSDMRSSGQSGSG
jgi:hypothetical protein